MLFILLSKQSLWNDPEGLCGMQVLVAVVLLPASDMTPRSSTKTSNRDGTAKQTLQNINISLLRCILALLLSKNLFGMTVRL